MPFRNLILLGLFSAMVVTSQTPPTAPRVAHREVWHGATVTDDYFWLREKSNPRVTQYLEVENAFTAAITKDVEPFSGALYKEMLGRIKQTDLSVPTPLRGYLYYSRTEEGKQYPIECRRKGTMEAPEEVLLDLNELGKDKKFVGLGGFVVSDDQNLLAYTIDYTGFRQFALRVKDLRTGQTLPDTAERVTSLAWAADSKTLFLVTEDALTKRRDKLWRHVLGTAEFEEIYNDKDELYDIKIGKTRRPEISVSGKRVQGHLRSALPARRSARGHIRCISAARKRPPLLPGPSRRAVLYPDQQGRSQFRRDDRGRERLSSGKLESVPGAPRRRARQGY
jgi:oligopeptidase B